MPPVSRRYYWTTQLRLLPHANRYLGHPTYTRRRSAEDVQELDLSRALSNLGSLYMTHDKMAAAETIYQWALAGYEKVLGSDHTSTLNTLHNPNDMPTITLPNGKKFSAEASETLLDAALRSGNVLEFNCKTDRCGSCWLQVRHGPTIPIVD